jgi:hypothetical protein
MMTLIHGTRHNVISLPFLLDLFSWVICGFGVKPSHTIILGIAIIFLFSGIYANPISLKRLMLNVYLDECIFG